MERGFEGVETAVVPFDQAFFAAAPQVGDMDPDRLGLADPVQPADALLEQAGIEREIEQDQAMRELKVAALAADLRANQELGPVRLGEPGGLRSRWTRGRPFVEQAGFDRHFSRSAASIAMALRADLQIRRTFSGRWRLRKAASHSIRGSSLKE